jgi:predicted permease
VRRLRAALARVRALLQRGRLDRELAAELDSHLSLHIDDNLRAGMTPHEARRQALLKLGGVAQVEERYRRARGIPAIEHVIRDARLSARRLLAMPGFTIVAVATLGLGIGANAAIFGVLNAALFQPLPVERPANLVMLNRNSGVPTHSYPDYRDFRDRNTVLAGLVAYRFSPMNFDASRTPTRIWGYLVTGNYFEVLGVRPILGRTFTASEDRIPGAHRVAVLSYGCWQRQFGGAPDVVGRSVRINGEPFMVLGVMPKAFRGTELLFTPEVWVPMSMVGLIESGNDWLERRGTHNIFVLGRLKDAISHAHAEASLNIIATDLGREHPALNEGMRITLSPPGLAGNFLRGPVLGFSGALLAIAGLVLLLACTNLIGLVLARATDRRRDTAVRLALGASRSDLIRRSLVESAIISLAGTMAALVLAFWLVSLFGEWRPPVDLPLTTGFDLDYRVALFALGLAACSTILVGLLPALQDTRTELVPSLKEDTPWSRSGWHLRDLIVGVQMAISTILLIGSLLVVRGLHQATQVDVGFNPSGAVSARVDLGLEGYDQARAREFHRRVLDDIAAQHGVESVSVANALPLSIDLSTHRVYVEGKPEPRGADVPSVAYYQVTPAFFRTLQTRLIAGRDFAATDTPTSPRVAIVNQAFVTQLIGAGDPIGKRFRLGRASPWIEIVGVVQDGKIQSLTEAPTPVAFHPLAQWYNPTTTIVARTSLADAQAVELVRQAVGRVDAGVTVFDEGPLSELMALPLFPARIAAVLLGGFGALAIVLVSVGTYGLMSYGIAQRTREICIRLAMGASSSHIVRLVLTRAAVVWAAGAIVGVAVALVCSPFLSPILPGVNPRHPGVVSFACALLAIVTLCACWLPARRAIVSNPVALLRRI